MKRKLLIIAIVVLLISNVFILIDFNIIPNNLFQNDSGPYINSRPQKGEKYSIEAGKEYEVGKDIPAGSYFVYTKEEANIQIQNRDDNIQDKTFADNDAITIPPTAISINTDKKITLEKRY